MSEKNFLNKKRKSTLNSKYIYQNIIIAQIENKQENMRHRIINSFENQKRIDNVWIKYDEMSPNEKEIKNCQIYINDIKVDFYYDFIFPDKGIYTIKYIFNKLLTSTCCMFFQCGPFISFDFSNFNTEKVKNMAYMFGECSIESLDISNLNAKNILSTAYIFDFCRSLKYLYLPSFNNKKLQKLKGMFKCCEELVSIINLDNLNTENVEDMSEIFSNCKLLKKLDLSGFNTKKVINMSSMFDACESLISLNISNFNTEKVQDMSFMFRYCTSLEKLDISHFNTKQVSNMFYMFDNCRSLISLNISTFNTKNVNETSFMFNRCFSLISLDISNFNFEKIKVFKCMFSNCRSLTTINADFSKIGKEEKQNIFENCNSLLKYIIIKKNINLPKL